MRKLGRGAFAALVCLEFSSYANGAQAQPKEVAVSGVCENFNTNAAASKPLREVKLPPDGSCSVQQKNGFPLPDPACTPGAINPTLTPEILRDPQFTTKCVRNDATTEQEKAQTYGWYKIEHPANNVGAEQICELDHLISLELGGADTLANIWPQCGPANVTLANRYFKEKDRVENYLTKQVKDGHMKLEDAQQGIAANWTQYVEEAKKACPGGKCE
jgi:hypothetical protein